MLSKKELKILKRVADKQRWKVLVYTMCWIAILIGVFFMGIGLILNEAEPKIMGLITGLPGIMAIVGIREQLKLFRIIKKLQKELEENKQTTHPPATETK